MRPLIAPCIRVLACARGSTLVGYSSLALLVAIAAITLLAHGLDAGNDPNRRAAGTISSD